MAGKFPTEREFVIRFVSKKMVDVQLPGLITDGEIASHLEMGYRGSLIPSEMAT